MRPRTPRTPRTTHHSVARHSSNSAEQHTSPHFPTHNKHDTTQTQEGSEDNVKGNRTTRRHQPKDRASQHTPSRHSRGPQGKRQGGRQHTDGDADIRRESVTQPPFPHHATHHPLCHPTIHDGPTLHHDEGGADRGYPTTRTPQTHTHHPHTTHPAGNSARHDSSTRQHCNGTGRTRATPLHWAGQQQHAPPPFHTPRRMDTIHSSTRLLLLIHVHTTDDQR